MNDLSRDPQLQPAVATLPATGAPLEMTPATTDAPAVAAQQAPPANLPPVPALPPAAVAAPAQERLLSPEEQAKVIAELEALAARQGAPTTASQAAEDECAKLAGQALDPEVQLKREREGLKC